MSYAVLVTVGETTEAVNVGDLPDQLIYGPYKTAIKAGEVAMKLQSQGTRAGVEVEALVMPLVRSGIINLIDEHR